MSKYQRAKGFTIVELLIVIVVIAILAAISVVAYNGIQTRAREVKIKADFATVQQKIELYYVDNGHYPVTNAGGLREGWSKQTARTDANCHQGQKYTDWVPDVGDLPQSDASSSFYSGQRGCYLYVSDGNEYVLSAWGMMASDMQGQPGYRLTGFRELDVGVNRAPFYICNNSTIAGGGNVSKNYYRHSYTISNIDKSVCG